MTYTYAIMHVSKEVYKEIRNKLQAAGYSDQIDSNGNLDMHGIALAMEPTEEPTEEPTMEEMEQELLKAGWTIGPALTWKNPHGFLFRGPHKAWHIMRRIPMCKI